MSATGSRTLLRRPRRRRRRRAAGGGFRRGPSLAIVGGEIVRREPVRYVHDDPSAGELAEQRTRNDHGRDRDRHTQCQRDTEISIEQLDRRQRSRVWWHQTVHRGKTCERRDPDGDQ
jgi:hypothetical protein